MIKINHQNRTTMKLTNEQLKVFTDQFNEQFTELQNRMIQYHDNMIDVLMQKDFDDDIDIGFFIQLADDAVAHKCKQFVDDNEMIKSAMIDLDETLFPDDYDDDETNEPLQ